jgi:hypothetical protein
MNCWPISFHYSSELMTLLKTAVILTTKANSFIRQYLSIASIIGDLTKLWRNNSGRNFYYGLRIINFYYYRKVFISFLFRNHDENLCKDIFGPFYKEQNFLNEDMLYHNAKNNKNT